jgi:tetratricopeptide (TPR) repeat protein
MIWLLFLIPLGSLVGLAAYSYFPRTQEKGATTIAVAEFDGPPLPDPYQDCRPSDMLIHTLSRVGARYGGLKAFELPYSIKPDNRWASWWAQFHGGFEAADVIVYGEYILYNSSGNVAANAKPDEIVINPEVARVPTIPLTFASAPLYSWNFSGSVARIADLCGSDLREAGHPARFLDDARRGALAIAGLQALGRRDFQTAQDALRQAQRPEVVDPQTCKGDPNQGAGKDSYCPGVLAFYLATLDARVGNLKRASDEYQYAAGRLGTPEPYINRGELFMRMGDYAAAFEQFDNAVATDPNSVAALATRAQYERDYLRPRQAALDLQRAIDLEAAIDAGNAPRPPGDAYSRLILSRAIYQRGGKGDSACGINRLGELLYAHGSLDTHYGADVLVRYGVWLRGEKQYAAAILPLQAAVRLYPEHIQGNYTLGLALEQSQPGQKAAAAFYLRQAEYAPAYTDEDYLYQGNAANEIASNFDRDPTERQHDLDRASTAYAQSMKKNHGAAYAYYDRAILEMANNPQRALSDLQMAANLHPYDAMLQSRLGQFLDAIGRAGDGKKYHDKASYVARARIPQDELGWSSQTCRYTSPAAGSS